MKIETAGAFMVAEVDEVREAQVVKVSPGDILALITDHPLSEKAIARIVEHFKPRLPEGVELVILERSHFQVIRSEESA